MKVKASRGTVQFEGGTFEKGEVFEASESKLKQFAVGTIEIISEPKEKEPTTKPEVVTPHVEDEVIARPRKKA